jgi:hypothetical protein
MVERSPLILVVTFPPGPPEGPMPPISKTLDLAKPIRENYQGRPGARV